MDQIGVLATIAFGLICSLIGIIYWYGRGRDDRQDARLEKHCDDDTKAHDRITALEVMSENHEREIASLRDKQHDTREEFRKAVAEIYKFLTEKILDRFK